MDQKSQIREKLVAVYRRLSPLDQALVQLCSVVYEPIDGAALLKCFRRTGLTFPEGNLATATEFESCINRLRARKLLTKSLQCHETIVEVCSRDALDLIIAAQSEPEPMAGDGEEVRKPAKQKALKPSTARPRSVILPAPRNRYELMVRAVQEEIPSLQWYGIATATTYCERAMRDLRIGLYTQNTNLLNKSYQQLHAHCSARYGQPGPLVRVCTNPFDAGWFRTLPAVLQADVLAEIFFHTVFSLDADDEALAYASAPQIRETIPLEKHPAFYHYFISRLLISGRLTEAEQLLAESRETWVLYGLEGWIWFLKGRHDLAIASFEADLKKLRRNLRHRKAYFGGLEGFFFILALLQPGPFHDLKKAGTLLEAALARHVDGSLLASSYKALKAIVQSLDWEAAGGPALLSEKEPPGGGLSGLFRTLALYWRDGQLAQEDIDTLSELFIKSREVGLNWLAMECAELLCRAEEPTPVRRNAIEKVRQETGMPSFVAAIRVEEPWRKCLRALTEIAPGARQGAAQSADARLIWLLDYRPGVLSVQPLEQKRSIRGAWTKGRAVALSRLLGGRKPDCLTLQDHAICATIEREGRSYYNTRYHFHTSRLLPALVGHPLLFLEKSPGVPVEVIKGEPEVLVTRADTELLIQFSLEVPEARVFLVQETPTRFKVVELSDHHLRIARILGEKGLKVPASAAREVMDAVTSISSQVTVHSAIGGISRDIEEVAADPAPRLHILPSGPGFRFEMFVQPLGTNGPYLKPGSGMENVIAEVDGKLMHTRRDLSREENLAEAVEAAWTTLEMVEENERQWRLDDLQSCLQVLLELKTLQDRGEVVLAWPEGEKLKVSREISFDGLRLRIRSKTDWFQIEGELQVDDHLILDMKRLLELIESESTRFLPLGEGQFVALTRDLRKRLEDFADYSERHGNELRLHPLAAMAIEDFTAQLPRLDADQGWQARLADMRSALQRIPAVPSTLKAELRDYQVEGYQWLARLAHLGLGGCLADDMGLGKTLQALALILERAPGGPTLVVAPTSVCLNWVSEANRFAPTLNLLILGGGNRERMVRDLRGMDVLVVSYGLLYQEAELLASVEWRTIVLDEAQAIKNVAAKRSQAAMNLTGSMRLITTGTPIENHLGELWTLFNFINPGTAGLAGTVQYALCHPDRAQQQSRGQEAAEEAGPALHPEAHQTAGPGRIAAAHGSGAPGGNEPGRNGLLRSPETAGAGAAGTR